MITNFGRENESYSVETVMASFDDKEPVECLEITPRKSEISHRFIIGEFTVTDKKFDNGDGEMKFSVSFLEVNSELNDEYIIKYKKIIDSIVLHILSEMGSEETA